MNTAKLNSQKSLKNIDWKVFFNMRIFRYTFLKQLKSISTYIFFCLAIIASGMLLWLSFSISTHLMGNLNDFDIERQKELAKIPIVFYKMFLYTLFIIIFTLFITFKSLQIFRDEMDDGTLLIFSSMSFSRFKLIIQKWLSLQVICLTFTLSVTFISPTIFLTIQGFSTPAWQVTKAFYENSLSVIIASIIFQVLISTFAVLISLYFGKTGTIGFLSLFSAVSLVIFFIPGIIESRLLGWGGASEMNNKMKLLGKKFEQDNLFEFYKDPDLKNFFEMDNWYTQQQFLQNTNHSEEYSPFKKNNSYEQLEFTFEPKTLADLHNILNSPNNSDIQQKKQAFLADINVGITSLSYTSKVVKEIIDLFNKTASKTINIRPVRVSLERKWPGDENNWKLDKNERKLINKSKDLYKTALDNNANLTQKENKIVALSKALFKDFNKVSVRTDTKIFINSLVKQYENYYNSIPRYGIRYSEQEIIKLLETDDQNKPIAYFANNPAFKNLLFLVEHLSDEIMSYMYQLNGSMSDKKTLEKYFKVIKVNNYLNIMTQISFIWNGIDDSLFALPNYYGEWEKKESVFTKPDGTSAKMEYFKIKPESFKRIISPVLLYIIYPLISGGLIGLLIYMVYKRDFV